MEHRGQLATDGAVFGCLVPAVGWLGCSFMQAGALAVRVQERGRGHTTDNVVDVGVTVASGGILGDTSSVGEEALGSGSFKFLFRLHGSLPDIFNTIFGG